MSSDEFVERGAGKDDVFLFAETIREVSIETYAAIGD